MKTHLKKIFLLIVVVITVMVCFAFSVSAETYNGFKYEISFGEINITGYIGDATDIDIPSEIKGKPVTSIDRWAFENHEKTTSVKIPESITSVGECAFYGCVNLKSIEVDSNNKFYTSENGVLFNKEKTTIICFPIGNSNGSYAIPNQVSEIGSYAFCKAKLTNIIIPDSVIYIGKSAFYECKDMEEIKIPNSVTSISNYAFYGCEELGKIFIPDSVVDISGTNAFLIKSEGLHNNAKVYALIYCNQESYIADYAQKNCLPYVYIDVGNEENIIKGKIGTRILWELDKNNAQLTISGKGKIPLAAATQWENIKSYVLKLIIDEGITAIDGGCFSKMYSLREIHIPSTLAEVGLGAFCEYWYENLLKDIYAPNIETWLSIDFDVAEMAPFEGADNLYFDGVLAENVLIPAGIETVGEFVFSGFDCIKSVVIGKSVKEIKDYAFIRCFNLNKIVIGENVEIIEERAFDQCKSLSEVIFDVDENYNSKIEYIWNVFRESPIETFILPYSVKKVYGIPSRSKKIIVYNPKCVFDENCGLNYTHTIIGFKDSSAEKIAYDVDATFIDIETVHKHEYKKFENKNYCSYKKCFCGKESVVKHTSVTDKAVPATCTKTGLTEGSHCSVCKEVIKKQEVTAKKAHTNTTSTTKATLKKNGKTVTKCTVCGTVKSTTTIYYPKTIKLSATTLAYNGKTKTPTVTVKDSKGKTLKNGTDYTVTYPKKRKSIGKYTVTVTFKGNYSGTKKLTFEIVPAKVSISKVSAGKKQLTATWKTVSGATGYEVVYSTSKKFTKKTTKTVTIKKAKTKKTTIKKLKKGKKYYVKVRAYKTVGKNKIYGAWSSVKNVKVK